MSDVIDRPVPGQERVEVGARMKTRMDVAVDNPQTVFRR